MLICFFHVSVWQHKAKLSQHHQQGQVGENTEAQIRRETSVIILHSGSVSTSPASLGCPSAKAALLSLQSSVWARGLLNLSSKSRGCPWCAAWLCQCRVQHDACFFTAGSRTATALARQCPPQLPALLLPGVSPVVKGIELG